MVIWGVFPSITHGAVLINEIAWMGTEVGPNEEWIELYNTDSETVSLDGWVLTDGVSLSITLAGVVGAGEYALLERTDDTTVPNVTAFLVYVGALANDGRTLTLQRASGVTEDQVIGGSDWKNIGGNNESKATPQRTSQGWITGAPTPGGINHAQNTEVKDTQTKENDITRTIPLTQSVRATGAGERVSLTPSSNVLSLSIDAPLTVYVNQRVPFRLVPSGLGKTLTASLSYEWNFGDGTTGEGRDVSHLFTHAGEYAIVAHAEYAEKKADARMILRVLPVSLTLSYTNDGAIAIENTTNEEIDVSGFALKGTMTFVFPARSFILPQGKLIIPAEKITTSRYHVPVTLSDAQKVVVAQYPENNSVGLTQFSSPVVAYVGEGKSADFVAAEHSIASKEIGESTTSTSPIVSGATIPLYTTATKNTSQGGSSDKTTMPYIGLAGIVTLGILALYARRPHTF